MTTHEINEWISDLTDGLPVTLIITRLALTIVALVESGGRPAEDVLRAIVAVRGEGYSDVDAAVDEGFSRQWDMS